MYHVASLLWDSTPTHNYFTYLAECITLNYGLDLKGQDFSGTQGTEMRGAICHSESISDFFLTHTKESSCNLQQVGKHLDTWWLTDRGVTIRNTQQKSREQQMTGKCHTIPASISVFMSVLLCVRHHVDCRIIRAADVYWLAIHFNESTRSAPVECCIYSILAIYSIIYIYSTKVQSFFQETF